MSEYYIEIKGTQYSLVQGVPHIERLDEELDTAKVIIRKLSRRLPFDPYTEAILSLGDFKRRYLIVDDQVLRISATRNIYTHTINLVSYEKILDINILPNIAFSNTLKNGIETRKTVEEQLSRLKNIYPTRSLYDINNGIGTLFSVDSSGEQNRFLKEPTNQLFLGGKSVLGCIKSIMQRTKHIAYMNLDNKLLFKNLNGFGNNLTNEYLNSGNNNFTGESLNQDANYFCDYIKSSVDNGIGDNLLVYPAINQYINVRADVGEVLKETNCKLILPYPIEYISKITMKFNTESFLVDDNGNRIDGTLKRRTATADVTKFFVEKDVYATLKTPSANGDFNYLHQGNTFYYTKNDNKIIMDGNFKNLFILNVSKIEYFLSSVKTPLIDFCETSDGRAECSSLENNNKWNQLLFNIEYKPVASSLVRVYKQDKENVDASFSANFSENRLEVDRVVDNMSVMVNRLGNEELVLSRHIKGNEQPTKINDFIKLNDSTYKCVNTETSVYANFKQNIAKFTKNYNHVSNYVGVDTEFRQYDIPRKAIKRNIEYDDFIKFSINSPVHIEEQDTYIYSLNFLRESLTGVPIDKYETGNGQELFSGGEPSQHAKDYSISAKYNGKNTNIDNFVIHFSVDSAAAQYSCDIFVEDEKRLTTKVLSYNSLNGKVNEIFRDNSVLIKSGDTIVVQVSNNEYILNNFNSIGIAAIDYASSTPIDSCIWGSYHNESGSMELDSGYYENEVFKPSRLIIPVRKQGSKNTCIFDFGFDDSIVGGNAVKYDGSVGYNIPVNYCKKDGTSQCIKVSLCKNITKSIDYEKDSNKARLYPIKDGTDGSNFRTFNSLFRDDSAKTKNYLYIDKDKAESLSMTYQIHFIPENPSEMTVNNFGEFCAFIDNSVKNLGIVVRGKDKPNFTYFDDVIDTSENIEPIAIDFTLYINSYGVIYDTIDLGRKYENFALVDIDSRKILLSCKENTQYIYVYRSHKR